MIDNIKDDLKDKVTDKLYSIIKNYLLSHIYGSILVATVVITSASVIFNTVTNKVEIKKIESRPVLVASKLDICKNSIQPKLICNDSFGFNDDNMCVRIKEVDAKKVKICSEGYHLNGSKCVSDKTYEKTTKEVCQKPSELPDFLDSWDQFITMVEDVDPNTGELLCGMQHCTDSTCNAGTVSDIPTTTITSCSEGSFINGECKKSKSATTEYTCEEGTLDGKKCNIETLEEPVIQCNQGYEYNTDCKACVEVE